MEKEFLGILMATLNFREYLESSPLTYILSDSQSVLWALCHQGDSLKNIKTSYEACGKLTGI
jgi:hypothetical protein